MVVDSSALVAILLGESDADAMIEAIISTPNRLISACSYLESFMVMSTKLGDSGSRSLDYFLHRMNAEIVPFTRDQSVLALEGWRRYGKGRHPAGLNFGDCCSYGLCLSTGEPLLFKGDDFSQTDLSLVSY